MDANSEVLRHAAAESHVPDLELINGDAKLNSSLIEHGF
jgi:hypothetical protein